MVNSGWATNTFTRLPAKGTTPSALTWRTGIISTSMPSISFSGKWWTSLPASIRTFTAPSKILKLSGTVFWNPDSLSLLPCSIEDEANYYRLHVEGFSGTVEDSFAWYHNKRSFSTSDSGNICAAISHAGWWYHQCFFSNLNGVYYKVRSGHLASTAAYHLTGKHNRGSRRNHSSGREGI